MCVQAFEVRKFLSSDGVGASRVSSVLPALRGEEVLLQVVTPLWACVVEVRVDMCF